jgi:ABC-type uncharacterized transport system permease subunit
MKTLAFVFALCIAAIGVVGFFAPSVLVWAARHSDTAGAFYVIAAVRIAVGLLLVSVASSSRRPKVLSAIGYVIVIAGIATALTGLFAMEQARSLIAWWLQQPSGVLRFTAVVVAAVGGFVAHACAPDRGTA